MGLLTQIDLPLAKSDKLKTKENTKKKKKKKLFSPGTWFHPAPDLPEPAVPSGVLSPAVHSWPA
jgi:hypothetical protein